MNLQSILAGLVVLGAILFLIKMKYKKGSCAGGGCGCSSTEKKIEQK